MTDNIEPSVLEKLLEVIEQNGSVTQKQKDQAILWGLQELLTKIKGLDALTKRVDALEKKNLITIYEKHPKMAIAITFCIFVILNYAAHAVTPDQWFGAIAKALGIP
jgi:hypothetical protein